MNSTDLEVEKLRPAVLATVERLGGDDLAVLHRILLRLEKARLWRELSDEFATDAQTGKYGRLDEIIREARTELRAR